MEVAFISMDVEVVFSQVSADFVDMFSVLLKVIQIDENVVQIYKDTYVEHVREDVIHEVLKSCQCISQTEGHNTPFEGAISGVKGGFPFVTFLDLDEVVHVLQVNYCIYRGLSWTVKEVGDMWKWVSVLFGDFVEASEVSAKLERAVFLLSEEDRSAVR